MLALPLLLIVAVVVWVLAVSGERFLPAFAALLTDATLHRGPFAFVSGRSYSTGRFEGREVAARLQLKRRRYEPGYFVIAMRINGAESLDYTAIDVRTQDAAGRRALASIAAQELMISVEEGWLKALWKPAGFVIFPGRFTEERWRQSLAAMQTIATSLELSGSISPGTPAAS